MKEDTKYHEGILITDNSGCILFFNKIIFDFFPLEQKHHIRTLDVFISSISSQITNIATLIDLMKELIEDPQKDGILPLFLQNGKILQLKSYSVSDCSDGVFGRTWIFTDSYGYAGTSEGMCYTDDLFMTIFNLIPEGIAISDIKTGIFYEVNSHFTEFWGYTREEVIGKSAIDLNFWVDIHQREELVTRLKRNRSCEKVLVKMRKKDGEICDILMSISIISLHNSRYMLSIPLDISEIIRSEEKNRSLASFIELNPCPILEIDRNAKITMNNEAAIQTMKKLTGDPDITLFIPDQLDEIVHAITQGINTTFSREIEIAGHFFQENIYITNQYRTARIYVLDVTHRKKAEQDLLCKNNDLAAAYEEIASAEEELRDNYERLLEHELALRETKNKLRMILDHIPGILVTTNKEMKITGLFGAGLKEFGLSPNERLGCRLEEVFNNPESSFVDAHKRALLGELHRLEGVYNGRDVIIIAEPLLDTDDNIIGSMGISFDITEQKKLEKERNTLYHQVEKNFIELATINDTIRNPLSVISILIEMYAPQLEDKINPYVTEIDSIIQNIDKRWIESEKIILYLQKHYNIGT